MGGANDGLKRIAVLCAAARSVYHTLPGVEVYDRRRDARSFGADRPIVAHPPCRAWSAFCRHQANPDTGERELGLWCCDMLRKCGGVLEQPAFSHLFAAGGLPAPGTPRHGDIWSLEVWQSWWGYPTMKRTWLAFSGISPSVVVIPYRLHNRGSDRRTMQLMSHAQRSETTPEFAQWLVDIARLSGCH